MKYFAILILIIAFPRIGCSQSPTKQLAELGKRINIAIEKEFKPDSTVGNNFCQRGCFFVRFKYITGKIEPEIYFISDSAAFINRALTNAIRRIRNNSPLIKDLKKKGQTYVLPVIYDYDSGCNFRKLNANAQDDSLENRYLYLIITTDKGHQPICILSTYSIC